MDPLEHVRRFLGREDTEAVGPHPVVERVSDTITGSLVNRSQLGNRDRGVSFYTDTAYVADPYPHATVNLYQEGPAGTDDPFLEVYVRLDDPVRAPGYETDPDSYTRSGMLPPIEEIERTVEDVLRNDPDLEYDPPR